MKMYFKKLLLLITIIGFVACGSDDEPEPNEKPTPKPIDHANWVLPLGDYTFYFSCISYSTISGSYSIEAIHSTKDTIEFTNGILLKDSTLYAIGHIGNIYDIQGYFQLQNDTIFAGIGKIKINVPHPGGPMDYVILNSTVLIFK